MDKLKILWADDEIELLKPHILFLNSKGYEVVTALSGDEAYDIVKEDTNARYIRTGNTSENKTS
jgi:DNA-binding response OmpR family regulator